MFALKESINVSAVASLVENQILFHHLIPKAASLISTNKLVQGLKNRIHSLTCEKQVAKIGRPSKKRPRTETSESLADLARKLIAVIKVWTLEF